MACFLCGKSYAQTVLYFDFNIREVTSVIMFEKHRARAEQDAQGLSSTHSGENSSLSKKSEYLKREEVRKQWARKVTLMWNVLLIFYYYSLWQNASAFIHLPAYPYWDMRFTPSSPPDLHVCSSSMFGVTIDHKCHITCIKIFLELKNKSIVAVNRLCVDWKYWQKIYVTYFEKKTCTLKWLKK